MLGLILAYAAAITSLGLALATWVSRLGRAVALCVSAYVAFSIGWVVVSGVVLSGRLAYEGLPLIMGSPLYATPVATLAVSSARRFPPDGDASVMVGSFLWTLIHGGIAAFLFVATLSTFDRCLGRVPETGGHPIPRTEKVPWAEQEPELDEFQVEDAADVSEPAP